MDSLPAYVVHQILKRSSLEDRLISLQCVCEDWRRWTPLDDLVTLKISKFERLRLRPDLWTGQIRSREYFECNQVWLEALLRAVLPRAGHSIRTIVFDSIWPCVNDAPPMFCTPEGFKRWTLTKPMLELIWQYCGRVLRELILIEPNFVYTEIEQDAYPIFGSFSKLRRLAVARVEASFGPHLRQLSLRSLSISGENAPMETGDNNYIKSIHLAHPLPQIYTNQNAFYLSRLFPNLEYHSEQLMDEFDRMSESAQRKRLTDYRQLPNFKRFRIQLSPENTIRTDLPTVAGFGLPKLEGRVNLQIRQPGDVAANIRYLGNLKYLRVEGLMNMEDAIALFSGMTKLEKLDLTCHWALEDADNESIINNTEERKISLPNLRKFRLILWESAPRWLCEILKRAFGSCPNLRSVHLEDYSDDDRQKKDQTVLLDEIGLNQIHRNLKHLTCKVATGEICKENLTLLMRNIWPKLSSVTWHATRLHFDQQSVTTLVLSFPNLKRFILVPPTGPLRPLLRNSVDDAVCQFENGALVSLVRGLKKLQDLRLFACSVVDGDLVREIGRHGELNSVKLWEGTLSPNEPFLDEILSQIRTSSIKKSEEGYRKKAVFLEVFTLRPSCTGRFFPQCCTCTYSEGNIFFLANARSYAIDEQTFYFP